MAEEDEIGREDVSDGTMDTVELAACVTWDSITVELAGLLELTGSLVDCAEIVETGWFDDAGWVVTTSVLDTGVEMLEEAVLDGIAEVETGSELVDGVPVAGATDRSELVSVIALVLPVVEEAISELDVATLRVEDAIPTDEVDSTDMAVDDPDEVVSRKEEEPMIEEEEAIIDSVDTGVLETDRDDTVVICDAVEVWVAGVWRGAVSDDEDAKLESVRMIEEDDTVGRGFIVVVGESEEGSEETESVEVGEGVTSESVDEGFDEEGPVSDWVEEEETRIEVSDGETSVGKREAVWDEIEASDEVEAEGSLFVDDGAIGELVEVEGSGICVEDDSEDREEDCPVVSDSARVENEDVRVGVVCVVEGRGSKVEDGNRDEDWSVVIDSRVDSVDVNTSEEEVENNLLSDIGHATLDQSGRSKTSRDTHEDVADDSVEIGVVDDEISTEVDEDSPEVEDWAGEGEDVDEAVSEVKDDRGSVASVEESELTGAEEEAAFDGDEVEDSAIVNDEGDSVAVESSEDDLLSDIIRSRDAISSVWKLRDSLFRSVLYSRGSRWGYCWWLLTLHVAQGIFLLHERGCWPRGTHRRFA
jgi:hypothetical protein